MLWAACIQKSQPEPPRANVGCAVMPHEQSGSGSGLRRSIASFDKVPQRCWGSPAMEGLLAIVKMIAAQLAQQALW